MSPGLVFKAVVGVFSFGEKLEFVFTHDSSVKEMHTDQAVSVLECMQWSTRSPDFNFIKHVWDARERHVAALNPSPVTRAMLSKPLVEQ
ncbi:hypothetical protein TNCV_3956921 [Trichonephila clavipes]|nr:hypothetical protein TNCV_3956921 [Trichonephila clavipes]